MPDAPGNPDAGFLAFVIVNRLIETLSRLGILPKADAIQMLSRLADELAEEARALSKPGAEFIRDRILPNIKSN
jgi:hypothetical protein